MIQHVLEGYSTTFEEDHDAATNVNEVFAWVTCAESPLNLSEIKAILDWVSGPDSELIWLERTLRIQLASVLVLTREDGLTTADLQETDVFSEEFHAGDVDLDDADEEVGAEDMLTEFDSNPATTQVTFSHASIGDFFRDGRRGKVSSGEGCPAVGVQLEEAQAHCASVLLDVLYKTAFPEKGVTAHPALIDHARRHWLKYFTQVDISKTSKAEKERIGGCLAKLLLLDHDSYEFITFLRPTECITSEIGELFNKWLSDPDVSASSRRLYARNISAK